MTTIDDSAFTALPLTLLATVSGGCGDGDSDGSSEKHHKHHKHSKDVDSTSGGDSGQNNLLSSTMNLGNPAGTKVPKTTTLTNNSSGSQSTVPTTDPTVQPV